MAALLASDPPAAPSASAGPHVLDDAACRLVLARAGWGVLAVSTDDGPYAVPVSFAVVEDRVYVASGPGLKREAIERDGRLCLTVCDVTDGGRWRSVVVRGAATPVRRVSEQMRAVAAFVTRAGARSSAAAAARLRGARLYSLPLDGMTGRGRG